MDNKDSQEQFTSEKLLKMMEEIQSDNGKENQIFT